MKIEIEVTVRDFQIPDTVSVQQDLRQRQDGYKTNDALPLAVIDVETLDKLCADFRAGVFKKAGKVDPAIMTQNEEDKVVQLSNYLTHPLHCTCRGCLELGRVALVKELG